jgi:hypothetical protein
VNLVEQLYQPRSLTCRWILRSEDRDAIARVSMSCLGLLKETHDSDPALQEAAAFDDKPLTVWRRGRRTSRVLTEQVIRSTVADIRSGEADAVDVALPATLEAGPSVGFIWDEGGDLLEGRTSLVLGADLARFGNAATTAVRVHHFRTVADDVAVVGGYITAGITSEALGFTSPYEDAVGHAAYELGIDDRWKTAGGESRGAFWGNLVSHDDMRRIERAGDFSLEPDTRPFLVERHRHAWYVQLRSEPAVVDDVDLSALQAWLEPALIGAGIAFDADPRVGVVLPRRA